MTLLVLFLAAFVAGLGLAVYAMLQGVERSRSRHRPPSALLNAPTFAAFALVFGAVGYLLMSKTALGSSVVVGSATAGGLAAAAGMVMLVARWALPYAGVPTEDDGVQGQLAVVTRPIFVAQPGEIAFDAHGSRKTLAAESVQGSEIPVDTEVVIDGIENGIARVELWSTVEQRL